MSAVNAILCVLKLRSMVCNSCIRSGLVWRQSFRLSAFGNIFAEASYTILIAVVRLSLKIGKCAI